MKKIGLFYATKADKTTWVAEKIQKEFGKDKLGRMILQHMIVL